MDAETINLMTKTALAVGLVIGIMLFILKAAVGVSYRWKIRDVQRAVKRVEEERTFR